MLGFFGLIAALVGSITVTQMASSMQHKVDNQTQVQQMFQDFEYAVNSAYLKENLDLRAAGVDGPNARNTIGAEFNNTSAIDAMLPWLRWSRQQLLTDPWRTPIRYYAYEDSTVFYSNPNDSNPATVDGSVVAPVVYWVLVSAGPDRAFSSGPDGDGSQPSNSGVIILNYANYPQGGDDIVLAFSTLAAMRAHYNNFQAIEEKVANLALKSYREQVTAFMRTDYAEDYMADRIDDLLNPTGGGGTSFIDGEVYRALLQDPLAHSQSAYPHMNFNGSVTAGSAASPAQVRAEDFGAEGEMAADPFFLGANINPAWELRYVPDTPWQLVLRRSYDVDLTGWTIETERTISGLDTTP